MANNNVFSINSNFPTFGLEFAKNNAYINFGGAKAAEPKVFTITEGWRSMQFGNALVDLWLNYYKVMDRGIYLHCTFEEALMTLEDKNIGYMLGNVVADLIKNKTILAGGLTLTCKTKVEDIAPASTWRIGWDGFSFYAAFVPYVDYEEGESKKVEHNRNALHIVRCFEQIRRAQDLGYTALGLHYWDDDAAYFEGERGLKVKYLLFKGGMIDQLRALVNSGIDSKLSYQTGQAFKYLEAKAAEGDEKAKVRLERMIARNEGKTIFTVNDEEISAAELMGRTFQLVAGNTTLTTRYTPSNENELNEAVSRIRSGIRVAFVDNFGDVATAVAIPEPTAKKASRKGRNVPEKVS
jgi:hypothetical protein